MCDFLWAQPDLGGPESAIWIMDFRVPAVWPDENDAEDGLSSPGCFFLFLPDPQAPEIQMVPEFATVFELLRSGGKMHRTKTFGRAVERWTSTQAAYIALLRSQWMLLNSLLLKCDVILEKQRDWDCLEISHLKHFDPLRCGLVFTIAMWFFRGSPTPSFAPKHEVLVDCKGSNVCSSQNLMATIFTNFGYLMSFMWTWRLMEPWALLALEFLTAFFSDRNPDHP